MVMKVLIPFQVRDIGGPSTFAKKFKGGIEQRGHTVTFSEYDDYDIVLVIVQAPFSVLWRARQKKKPIVQRLDGVYYWSVASWRFPLLNLKAFLIRHFFADYTIYQSDYSRKSTIAFLGPKIHEKSTTIYNGVDLTLFTHHGKKKDLRDFPEQKIFFTASEFRRRDQIFPIIKALEFYAQSISPSFKLVVAGNFSRELAGFESHLPQYPWAQFLGKIPNEELPLYERGADVFLFTHLNPPCPNNIIEALGCGLPICGVADGAMPELVETGKQGYLIPAQGGAFWRRRKYALEEFAKNIDRALKSHAIFSEESRRRAEAKFSLESMLNQYETILKSLL